MGIVGKEIGSSIRLKCPACGLPVHVVVESFDEDVNCCPHCGGALLYDELPGETKDYISRVEAAIHAWRTREHGPRHSYILDLKSSAEQLADKIVRTNYKDPQRGDQPSPMLEHVIVRIAKQRLLELESYAKEHDTIADVHSRFSELTGLTELAKLQDCGLSEVAVKQLEDIDSAALRIMQNLAQ